MSKYYNAQRTRNLFDPDSAIPFRLSRAKLEASVKCPRCFYLDRRLGVAQPPSYPFSLNSAVDRLLKSEFDIHRANGTSHPLMKEYGINAIPLAHDQIDTWRDSLRKGIQYLDPKTNFLVTGGVDDVWVDPKGELMIVDYKSTSKDGEVNLDADWQDGYKRQMEIYQWLFRKNGFKVSKTGYFVYCNGNANNKSFDAKLEFDIKVIPYKGDDRWVEPAIKEAHKILMGSDVPVMAEDCDFCLYTLSLSKVKGISSINDGKPRKPIISTFEDTINRLLGKDSHRKES